MKATNKETGHNRTILLTEIPIPASELDGHAPLFTELEIAVNYTEPRDGRRTQRAVTLDSYVIPLLLAAINGDKAAIYNGSEREPGGPGKKERSGEVVTIVRPLNSDEADEDAGPMYRVRFRDGTEIDAFSDELTPAL